jgi:hypothetical protein
MTTSKASSARPPVGGRIGQRLDDLQLLEHRARPAVRDDYRQGVRVARADADEVNVQPLDHRHELRESVQPRLRLSPVVAGSPVADELLQARQLSALGSIADGLLVRPPRREDAAPEVDELIFRNVDAERADCVTFGPRASRRGKQGGGTHGC